MNKTQDLSTFQFIKALFKQETPFYIKGIIVLAFIYFFVPLDLLPSAIAGPLGLVDDALVMAILTKVAKSLLETNLSQDPETLKDVTPEDY